MEEDRFGNARAGWRRELTAKITSPHKGQGGHDQASGRSRGEKLRIQNPTALGSPLRVRGEVGAGLVPTTGLRWRGNHRRRRGLGAADHGGGRDESRLPVPIEAPGMAGIDVPCRQQAERQDHQQWQARQAPEKAIHHGPGFIETPRTATVFSEYRSSGQQ